MTVHFAFLTAILMVVSVVSSTAMSPGNVVKREHKHFDQKVSKKIKPKNEIPLSLGKG